MTNNNPSTSFSNMLKDLQNKAANVGKDARKRKRDASNEMSKKDEFFLRKRELGDFQLDFLVIGAQKAGTTWMHDMLSRDTNENIILPAKKEVHFWDWNRRKGLKWYANQFQKKTRDDQKVGEINPCYAVLREKDVLEIKSLFPNLKLVFVARCKNEVFAEGRFFDYLQVYHFVFLYRYCR